MSVFENFQKFLKSTTVRWSSCVVFTALFLYWLAHYDFLSALKNVEPLRFAMFCAASALMLFLMQFFRGWRLSCLLSGRMVRPDKAAYQVSILHNFYAMLIPARLGELSFLPLSKRFGLNTPDSLKMLLHMRLFDLFLVILLFLASGKAFWHAVDISFSPYMYVIPIAALIGIALFMRRYVVMAYTWLSMEFRLLRPVLLLSLFIILCHTAGTWLMVQAFDIPLTLWQTTSIVAAGMLAFALPLSGVANVGPYHAVWILAAGLYSVNADLTLAAGTIYHLLALISLGLQAAFILLRPPNIG